MNNAKEYFEKQLSNPDFVKNFLAEKLKLDIEYELNELETDIIQHKSTEALLYKLNNIKKLLNIS